MIDSKSLKNATGLTELLNTKGISLTTIEATPLSHIVAACDSVYTNDGNVDESMGQVASAARNEDHDGTIYELADLAAQSVLSTQTLLRTQVLPHIRKILDDVEAADVESKQTGLPYELVYRDIPFILTLEPTQRLIEQFAKGDQFESKEDINLGTFDLERILELIQYTNDSDFNNVLKSALVDDPELVTSIISVLTGSSFLGNVKSPVVLIALMVIAQNLSADEDNIPSGLNVSLSTYKYRLLWVTIGAAKQLASLVTKWHVDIKNRVLYADTIRDDHKIVVNKSVFGALVEAHNVTVESLIGNEILGRPYSGAGLCDAEAKARTKSKYDTELSMATRRNELENAVTYTQSIFQAVMRDARARSKDEEALALLGDTPESLVTRAGIACERLYASGVTGRVRDHLVAGLVCAIYYAHTDALIFLNIMGEVGKSNPDLPVDEVVLIARTEFVAWYVFKQLAVVKTQ